LNTARTVGAIPGTPSSEPCRATSAISASEWKPRSRAICSNISLVNRSTRSSPPALTRCSNASANTGSMPEEQPAIIEIVPVGAIVVTVALRRGGPSR
jgi:hypothetical protein